MGGRSPRTTVSWDVYSWNPVRFGWLLIWHAANRSSFSWQVSARGTRIPTAQSPAKMWLQERMGLVQRRNRMYCEDWTDSQLVSVSSSKRWPNWLRKTGA